MAGQRWQAPKVIASKIRVRSHPAGASITPGGSKRGECRGPWQTVFIPEYVAGGNSCCITRVRVAPARVPLAIDVVGADQDATAARLPVARTGALLTRAGDDAEQSDG